jgi:hypothetical protein
MNHMQTIHVQMGRITNFHEHGRKIVDISIGVHTTNQ